MKKFGNYRLIDRLGAGTFGEVWRAEDPSGAVVALKILRVDAGHEELFTHLFKHEFEILSELRHAHLARVFDFGLSPDKDHYFFTEELCPGANFLDAVRDRPLPYFEETLVQLLSALHYIHSLGVVHFDIKADNILVADAGGRPHVKVVDFGVAAKIKALPAVVGGTLPYMAPELITRSSRLDHRVDLYAVGILCLQALTRRLPFDPEDRDEIIQWHLEGRLPGSIWDGATAPPYLREVVEKMLEKNPDDRFSSALVVLNFLNVATGQRYKREEQDLEGMLPLEGPLVGREELLVEIREGLGKGGVVWIRGEQGIGKSRLLDEVRRLVAVKEIPFVHFACKPHTPTWAELSQALGIKAVSVDEPSEGWQVRRHVASLLQMAERRPFCLLLDDLHEADRETVQVIETIGRKAQETTSSGSSFPLLVIATTEEEEGEGPHLERLGPGEVQSYVHLVLGEFPRLATTAELLHQYSGGLPLLMVEGLRSMAPHIYRGESLEKILPPPGIDRLYGERISSLSQEEKGLLLAAALIFRPVSLPELSAILKKGPAEILRYAETCRRAGLLRETSSWGGEDHHYQPSSQALALDLVHRIDAAERESIHRGIAEGLEKMEVRRAEEIAYHLVEGGDPEKGKKYYRAAISLYKERGALSTAADLLVKTVALAREGSDEWFEWVEETARLLILTGSYEKASAYLEKLSLRPSFRSEELGGWFAFRRGDFASAREAYQRAFERIETGDLLSEITVENAIANIDLQMGALEEASDRFRRSLQLEGRLPTGHRKEIPSNNLGVVLALQGRFDEAIEFYRRRLRRVPHHRPTEEISLLNSLGYVLIQASRFDEAAQVLQDAQKKAEEAGALNTLFSILRNRITALLKESRYAESLEALRHLASLEERLGSPRDLAYNLLRQGSTYLILGMGEAARTCLEKGLKLALDVGDEKLGGWLLLTKAYCERESGNRDRSKNLLNQVADAAKAIPDHDLLAWARYALADLAFEGGDFEESRRLLSELGAILKEGPVDEEFSARRLLLKGKLEGASDFGSLETICLGNRFRELLWEVYDCWGRSALRRGNRAEARSLFEKGMRVLQSISESLPEEYRDRYLRQKGRQDLFSSWQELTHPEGTESGKKTVEKVVDLQGLKKPKGTVPL